jgi:hypothetical protein
VIDSSVPSRPPHLALRIFLLLFSLSEFLSVLPDLSLLQIPHSNPTIGWQLADSITQARRVLAPAIAAAAFGFALVGMLSRAVATMAVLLLVWAFDAIAWALALWGNTLPLDLASVPILAPRYVYPLLGVAALALLWRGSLGLAGTLALLPTGVTWLYWIIVIGIIVFAPD